MTDKELCNIACDECIKVIEKKIKTLEWQIQVRQESLDTKEPPFVEYDDIHFYSADEIQEAYGCDAFTSRTYDRLLNELEKAIKENDDYNYINIRRKQIKFYKHFLKELNDTKSIEGK